MIAEAINEVERLVHAGELTPKLSEPVTLPWEGTDESYLFRTKIESNGARGLGDVVKPFYPPILKSTTLTGFMDSVEADAGGDLKDKIVHVEDYLTVHLKQLKSDRWGVRHTLLTAVHTPIDAFVFDQFCTDPSKFIIGLQVAFLQTDELLNLIKLVSVLKAGNSVQTNDDGFTQTVTVKQGEIGAADVKMPPRVKLVPIRTFSEANAVQTEFLVRFKQTPDQTPAVALFNVDGTKWKGDTMRAIKSYLEKQEALKGVPIIA